MIHDSLARISFAQLFLLLIFSGCTSDGTEIIPIPDFPFDTPAALSQSPSGAHFATISKLRGNERSSATETGNPEVQILNPELHKPWIVKDLTMPVFLNRNEVHPKHPQIPGIRKATVILELWVELNGKPEDIRLFRIETEPPRPYSEVEAFVKAAVEAAKQFRFEPARKGNDKIRALVRIPIAFDRILT
jgi:TonB family protein